MAWAIALRTHGVEAAVVARIRMSLHEVQPADVGHLDPAALPRLQLTRGTGVRTA